MEDLTAEEARVVGSLAEKQLTTPKYYPLTFGALVNACNQSNNRNPVVSYDATTVDAALEGLRRKGLARVIHAGGGSRVSKYRHTLDETLGLDRRELALVAVLLLRGPQTAGELRGRTERMAGYEGIDDVEHDLERLGARETPLVVRLDRAAGQKEGRVATTLAPIATDPVGAAAGSRVPGRAEGGSIPPPAVPRIAPADPGSLDDDSRRLLAPVLAGGQGANLFSTVARHPRLFGTWTPFTGVLLTGALEARARELLILRVGWLCRAPYEFGQHVLIARRAGLTDDEIAAVREGPDAPGWTAGERALLRAADELHAGYGLTGSTWEALAGEWDDQQLLEIVFTVGQYHLVAMVTNAVGIEAEEGVPPLPAG